MRWFLPQNSEGRAVSKSDIIVAADVTERLRSDIVLGALRPGEWLRQIDLQDRYGCTRASARSALATLAAGQMVEHVPNRGFRVVQPSAEVRAQITEVRLMVELPAAEAIVASATAQDAARIQAAAEAFETGVDLLPYPEMSALNHAFHRALVAPLDNGLLADTINDLRERDLPGDWSSWSVGANVRRSSQDHLDMAKAVAMRDANRLRDVIRRHLTRWQDPS